MTRAERLEDAYRAEITRAVDVLGPEGMREFVAWFRGAARSDGLAEALIDEIAADIEAAL
ncbi:MAG: hypothetical protein OXG35_04395 [Acidobacteria bacterium]|nr:hypothetical protein [Acidobacteriota bacterium]